jgi:hypothetical protein
MMKINHSIALFTAGVVMILISLQLTQSYYIVQGPGRLLLPYLSQTPRPELQELKITAAGNRDIIHAQRQGELWLMANYFDYPLDVSQLQNFALQLQQAQLGVEKTAKSEKYSYLGVENITQDDAQGIEVSIKASSLTSQLVLGYQARQGGGQYVRIGRQSYLMPEVISLPVNVQQWLDKEILTLAVDDIASVRVKPQEGIAYGVQQSTADKLTFELVQAADSSPPALKYQSVLATLPEALSSIALIDVNPRVASQVANQHSQLQVILRDSSVLELNCWQSDGRYYLQIEAKSIALENHYLARQQPSWRRWQYQISPFVYRQLVRPLSDFID